MAITVVQDDYNPHAELGQALERASASIMQGFAVRAKLDQQEEIREKDRQFQLKLTEKQHNNALERAKQQHNWGAKSAAAVKATTVQNDRVLYRLMADGTTYDSSGYKTVTAQDGPVIAQLAAKILPHVSDEASGAYRTWLETMDSNVILSRQKDNAVRVAMANGATQDQANMVDAFETLPEFLTWVKDKNTATADVIMSLIEQGELDPNVVFLLNRPTGPREGPKTRWDEVGRVLAARGITRKEVTKHLSGSPRHLEYLKNQRSLESLRQGFAQDKNFAATQALIQNAKKLNLPYEVVKAAVEQLTTDADTRNEELAIRYVLGQASMHEEPDAEHLTTLFQSDNPAFVQIGHKIMDAFAVRREQRYDYRGGSDLVKEMMKNPFSDHTKYEDYWLHADTPVVQNAAKLISVMRIARGLRDPVTKDPILAIPEDDAGLKDYVTRIRETYWDDPNRYLENEVKPAMAQHSWGHALGVLEDLGSGDWGSIKNEDLEQLAGLQAMSQVKGMEDVLSTLITAASNPTRNMTFGTGNQAVTVKVTPDNILKALEVKRAFYKEDLAMTDRGTVFSLLEYARGDRKLAPESYRAKMESLPPEHQKVVIGMLQDNKVKDAKLDSAVASGLVGEADKLELAAYNLKQLEEVLQARELTKQGESDKAVAAALLTEKDTVSAETLRWASAGAKTAYFNKQREAGVRLAEFNAAEIVRNRDLAQRAKVLMHSGLFPDGAKKDSIDNMLIQAAALNDTLTTTLLREKFEILNSDTKAQKDKSYDFLVNKVWGPWMKDVQDTLGGLNLDVTIADWDVKNKMPVIMTNGGETKLTPAQVTSLRSLKTNWEMYKNWVDTVGLDRGLLGSDSYSAVNAKGQRQYQVATAVIAQGLIRDALGKGKLFNWPDIYVYANLQSAKVKYDPEETASSWKQSANWKELVDVTRMDVYPGWKKHGITLATPLGGDPLFKGDQHASRSAIYENVIGGSNAFVNSESFQSIAKSDAFRAEPGSAPNQSAMNVITHIVGLPTKMERDIDGEGEYVLPAYDVYEDLVVGAYTLQELLKGGWKENSASTFEAVFQQQMEQEATNRKHLWPAFKEPAEKSFWGTGDAQADDRPAERSTHEPFAPMDKAVMEEYRAKKSYTVQEANYFQARLQSLKNILNAEIYHGQKGRTWEN